MLDFSSSLFYYKLIVVTELIFIEGLFTFRLTKRRHFFFRLITALLATYAAVFLFPIASYNAWYVSLIFIFIFAITIADMLFCFKEPFLKIFFIALSCYTIRHLAECFYTCLLPLFGFSISNEQYGSEIKLTDINAFKVIIYVDCYFITYWISYLFFDNKVNNKENIILNNLSYFYLFIFILVIDFVLNAVLIYRISEKSDVIIVAICYLYNAISCICLLIIQFSLLQNKKLETEVETAKRLWAQKKEQYEFTKENIDMINLKCHDLKHEIHQFGQKGNIDSSSIRQIENMIKIYDLTAETGNESLDVVLTEKSLLCKKDGIALSYMVDGKELSFISQSDLYALFGNMVDNAIEAVTKIEDRDKRKISLTVKRINNFVTINIQNYFIEKMTFKKGLPVTTKKDKANHGYGMKSIELIVNQYDGSLNIDTKNDIFNLSILFPCKPF